MNQSSQIFTSRIARHQILFIILYLFLLLLVLHDQTCTRCSAINWNIIELYSMYKLIYLITSAILFKCRCVSRFRPPDSPFVSRLQKKLLFVLRNVLHSE